MINASFQLIENQEDTSFSPFKNGANLTLTVGAFQHQVLTQGLDLLFVDNPHLVNLNFTSFVNKMYVFFIEPTGHAFTIYANSSIPRAPPV